MYDLHFRDITVRGFWLNKVRHLCCLYGLESECRVLSHAALQQC